MLEQSKPVGRQSRGAIDTASWGGHPVPVGGIFTTIPPPACWRQRQTKEHNLKSTYTVYGFKIGFEIVSVVPKLLHTKTRRLCDAEQKPLSVITLTILNTISNTFKDVLSVWSTWEANKQFLIIYMIWYGVYYLQCGFHQVAVVNKLVHKQKRNNYTHEKKTMHKTIQKRRTQKTESYTYKTRKQT